MADWVAPKTDYTSEDGVTATELNNIGNDLVVLNNGLVGSIIYTYKNAGGAL